MKKNKKVFICILSTIIGLVFLNIIISEVRVNSKVALIQLGMTEQEVINTCGSPTGIGAWSGSDGKGKSFTYSFPYCWDYVIWIFRSPKIFTNQKKIFIENANQCTIIFRVENEKSRVFSVERSGPYSQISLVVKRKE